MEGNLQFTRQFVNYHRDLDILKIYRYIGGYPANRPVYRQEKLALTNMSTRKKFKMQYIDQDKNHRPRPLTHTLPRYVNIFEIWGAVSNLGTKNCI